ncbi:diguanylate cyclase [Hahella sp. HN01]|uniref:GGDEF domain-containing response regulator n=1 Tax=Hahella sp. HN01 TaxID=2847262 RepID=UPI001C1EBD32|nr:diguanylate cyclase [Hahella sp. HN01]MBU6955907.1 diguanylate cyclase [Hahella sp. HN01]
MKVLIVDDCKAIRLLIHEYVTSSGHTGIMVNNGQQAIAALIESKFDLVLMDAEMPGISGFETTKRIREIFQDDWFPIVFLSSSCGDENIKKGIESGADGYLSKPISAVALTAQINAMARIATMRKELLSVTSKMKSIFDNAVDGIIIINTQGIIQSINFAAQKLFGYSDIEIEGKNVKHLMAEPFRSQHDSYLQRHIETKKNTIIGIGREVEGLRKDGSTFPFELSISELIIDDEHLFVGLTHDISERKKFEDKLYQAYSELRSANIELKRISLTDPLTQLANRRHFDQVLNQELKRAHRGNMEISLILCDIDHFKRFNDSKGHQAGDACLKRVGSAISRSLHRSTDVAARYGGEEFAIILPGTNKQDAIIIAENLRNAIWEEHIPHESSEVCDRVTLSLGVATSSHNAELSKTALIEQADQALYRAKEKGRNQSSF